MGSGFDQSVSDHPKSRKRFDVRGVNSTHAKATVPDENILVMDSFNLWRDAIITQVLSKKGLAWQSSKR